MLELPIILSDGTEADLEAAVAATNIPENLPMFPRDSKRLYVGKPDGTAHLVGWAKAETLVAVTTAGNSDLVCSAGHPLHLGRVTAGAGAGAYTRTLALPAAEDGGVDVLDGTIYELLLEYAASVNPTLEVRNETAGGTLLWSFTPPEAAARKFLARFWRMAGAWILAGANEVF